MSLPISFAIPADCVVSGPTAKSILISQLIPGASSSYSYGPADEAAYAAQYQNSYFALTTRKAGWDCLRHYEILASGAIPLFPGLEYCPKRTLMVLPKRQILDATSKYLRRVLRGQTIDSEVSQVSARLLAYTRRHLTTEALAVRFLDATKWRSGPVLFLSGEVPSALRPDYQRCLLLHGLKSVLGPGMVIDFPRIDHLYTRKHRAEESRLKARLYGNGFSYACRLEEGLVDREDLRARIRRRAFGLVVYGSVHRGTPYWTEVNRSYEPREIALVDGEDIHRCTLEKTMSKKYLYFRREAEESLYDRLAWRTVGRHASRHATSKAVDCVGQQILSTHATTFDMHSS